MAYNLRRIIWLGSDAIVYFRFNGSDSSFIMPLCREVMFHSTLHHKPRIPFIDVGDILQALGLRSYSVSSGGSTVLAQGTYASLDGYVDLAQQGTMHSNTTQLF